MLCLTSSLKHFKITAWTLTACCFILSPKTQGCWSFSLRWLVINYSKGIWVFFFHSPNSMSWSSVRMRMMLGRMLRRSRWNRGFSLWLDTKTEAWATANTASSTKSRAASLCVAISGLPLTLYWLHLVAPVGKMITFYFVSNSKWGWEVQSQEILAFQVKIEVVSACGLAREILFMVNY